MTKALLPSLAAASVLLGSGCQRHPAAQTVPGFGEQEVRHREALEKLASTPLAIAQEPPSFFPPKNQPGR